MHLTALGRQLLFMALGDAVRKRVEASVQLPAQFGQLPLALLELDELDAQRFEIGKVGDAAMPNVSAGPAYGFRANRRIGP